MPLVIVASLKRAQFRWNTELFTDLLKSTWDRTISVCTSLSSFKFQISLCSSKKTLITLDCKKAHPNRSTDFLSSSSMPDPQWALEDTYLYRKGMFEPPDCTLTALCHTQLYHCDLKLKAKKLSGQELSTAIQRQSRGPVSSLKYISLEHCTGYKLISSARGPQQVISGEWGMQGALRAKQCCNSAVK